MKLSLIINTKKYEIEADPRTLLLNVLRDDLHLLGTKCGCGEGECGACTVVLNGKAVNSCLTMVGQAHGGYITTIEGVANTKDGQTLIETFVDKGAVQCGFCTPGIAVSASAMVDQKTELSDDGVKQGLSGHLCRCTGYVKIIDAVKTSATKSLNLPELRQTGSLPINSSESPNFTRPASLEKTLEALADTEKKWKVLAGGTDLCVKKETPIELLNLLEIGGLKELKGISTKNSEIRIGAGTTFTELIGSTVIAEQFPSLVQAASQIGGMQIQNAGTIGGNIANSSPAADIIPPLISLGAVVVMVSKQETTSVSIEDFSTGFYQTVLGPNQLIKEILLPLPEQTGETVSFFDKLGARKALTISKVSIALSGHMANSRFTSVKIAMGSVAENVITAPQTADILLEGEFTQERLEQAAEMISTEARPIDDMFSTEEYCKQAVAGLLIRNLWKYLSR